jgi:YVTN family beta-propeller protein
VHLAVAAAALAAVALVLVLAGGGGTPAARAETLVQIDPSGSRTSGGLALRERPTSVVTCAGSVWVTNGDRTVSQIDAQASSEHVIHVQGLPVAVADVGGLAAVAAAPPRVTVTMIDAATGTPQGPVAMPGPPSASPVVTGFGRDVWVANPNAQELERLSPPYTAIAAGIPLPARGAGAKRYADVAFGAGAVWVAGDRFDPTLWRVEHERVVARIPLGFAPRAVAAGRDAVWVVDPRGAVVRVDPSTNEQVVRIRVGRNPVSVAAGSGSVWVVNRGDGTVSRIDPRRNAVVKTVSVGSDPLDVAAGLGSVWVVRAGTAT